MTVKDSLDNLGTDIHDILENVAKAKGENYAKAATFMLNVSQLTKVIGHFGHANKNDAPNDLIQHLASLIANVQGILVREHLEALGIEKEGDLNEVLNLVKQIERKVDTAAESIRKEG